MIITYVLMNKIFRFNELGSGYGYAVGSVSYYSFSKNEVNYIELLMFYLYIAFDKEVRANKEFKACG